jgi:hypothetical protein
LPSSGSALTDTAADSSLLARLAVPGEKRGLTLGFTLRAGWSLTATLIVPFVIDA